MIYSQLFVTLVSISTLVIAMPVPPTVPVPPTEPTFSVGGAPISTSPLFDRQHVYGNAPATKFKNTVVLPDQHVNLQPTVSGNLQSTHPVAIQEFKKGVPQPPRQGYVKVSQGRWGDINHYAATYPCKRSPGAPCPLPAAGVTGGSRFGSALGRAGRFAAGPEGMVASAAIDNAMLGYRTSSKYDGMMTNGGRDYDRAHAYVPYIAQQRASGFQGGGAGSTW